MLEEEENDLARWRVKWAGSVAMLRAVGHVLLYEDAPENDALNSSLNKRYKTWESEKTVHAIFWKFIKPERDALLKHYRFGAEIEDSIALGFVNDGASSLDFVEGDLYRPYSGEYRTNDDVRDLFSDAVSWWENELEYIWRNKE